MSWDRWWLFPLFFYFYAKKNLFVHSHIYRLVNHFFHWSNILNLKAIFSFHSFSSCKSTFVYETLVQFVSLMHVAILCANIHLTSHIKFPLKYLFIILIGWFVHYLMKRSKEFFMSLDTCSIRSYMNEIIGIIGIVIILHLSITRAITTTYCAVIRITTTAVCRDIFTLLFWLRIAIWNRQCWCFILYLWSQCLSFCFIFCFFWILNFILSLF